MTAFFIVRKPMAGEELSWSDGDANDIYTDWGTGYQVEAICTTLLKAEQAFNKALPEPGEMITLNEMPLDETSFAWSRTLYSKRWHKQHTLSDDDRKPRKKSKTTR